MAYAQAGYFNDADTAMSWKAVSGRPATYADPESAEFLPKPDSAWKGGWRRIWRQNTTWPSCVKVIQLKGFEAARGAKTLSKMEQSVLWNLSRCGCFWSVCPPRSQLAGDETRGTKANYRAGVGREEAKIQNWKELNFRAWESKQTRYRRTTDCSRPLLGAAQKLIVETRLSRPGREA